MVVVYIGHCLELWMRTRLGPRTGKAGVLLWRDVTADRAMSPTCYLVQASTTASVSWVQVVDVKVSAPRRQQRPHVLSRLEQPWSQMADLPTVTASEPGIDQGDYPASMPRSPPNTGGRRRSEIRLASALVTLSAVENPTSSTDNARWTGLFRHRRL